MSDEEWFAKHYGISSPIGDDGSFANEQVVNNSKKVVQLKPSEPAEPVKRVLQVGDLSIFEEEWPEPEKINDLLLPVKQLDLELIPEPFRDWISDTAHRMQCPIDFVTAAAIVITSSVIGAGCGIRPKANDDWLELPNLWGAIVGVPGKLKSPAIKKPLGLLAKLEAKAKLRHNQELKEYKVNQDEFELKEKALKTEMQATIEPAKPAKPNPKKRY